MKNFLAILIAFSLTACASGPSENDIQTAIAQTQAAQPTATPVPTPTPLPTPTPTPVLFVDKAKTYIPSESDMPEGFQLNPTGSGPIKAEKGDAYGVSFSNVENSFGFSGDAFIVIYWAYVLPTVSDAEATFQRISSNITGPLPPDFPFSMKEKFKEIKDADVPDVGESQVFTGVIDSPLIPAIVYVSIIRSTNFVGQIFVIGNEDPTDPTNRGILQSQSLYYVSLMTERLSP